MPQGASRPSVGTVKSTSVVGLPCGVDVAEVRQVLHERAEQQILRLHRGEVLAVDPDQVDRAALGRAGGLFGDDARHRLGGVGELDVDQIDAVALLHLIADPLDVGVDLRIAAPGVPVHRLAARLRERVVPGRRVDGVAKHERADGCQNSQQHSPIPPRLVARHYRPDELGVTRAPGRSRCCVVA